MATRLRAWSGGRVAVLALVGTTALVGCSTDGESGVRTDLSAAALPSGCALTVDDPWVKAADSGMTSVFATVSNPGTGQVTVVGASSPAADHVEIHEVVASGGTSVMQVKEGGLVIPGQSSVTLAPGADHLMLMGLTAPIQAGDEVAITLQCASGATTAFQAVAKPFDGADEVYQSPAPTGTETAATAG